MVCNNRKLASHHINTILQYLVVTTDFVKNHFPDKQLAVLLTSRIWQVAVTIFIYHSLNIHASNNEHVGLVGLSMLVKRIH